MKIYENLLNNFIKSPKDILTLTNKHITEVEAFGYMANINNLVVGKVLSKEKHPNADKLSVLKVDVGDEILDIVCGAKNVDKDQYVPIAKVGAVLPGDFKIKPSELRGVASNGMVCSLNELGVDEKLVPDAYKDGIYYFNEAKEVGADALKELGLDGYLMELDLTPNRSDLLSHYGFAKDLEAVIDSSVELPEVSFNEISDNNPLTVEIESNNTNSYYARYLTNIEVMESPMWLKNALTAMDCKPINNVVDITNYILYSYGIPMHAFDAKSFGSKKIVVKDNTEKQIVKTLDEQNIAITNNEILITNGKTPMALGGIMGLYNSMVTKDTKEIILEVASFDPKTTQINSKKIDLRSDSSLRFERGIDESLMMQAMNHASKLLIQLANAKVLKGVASKVKNVRTNPEIEISPRNIRKLLGSKITKKEILNILHKLNYEIKDDNKLLVTAPTYRNDIKIEADVVEEIARIYGVNNIENAPLENKLDGALTKYQKRLRRLKHHIAGLGFNEVVSYSLLKEEDAKLFNDKGKLISVLKPLTLDRKTLRQSLLNGTLGAIKYNMDRSLRNLFVFEVGNVYAKDIEEKHLALMATGSIVNNVWKKDETKVDFYYMKGILNNIIDSMSQKYELKPSNNKAFHPYQQANIIINKEVVGIIGKVHPTINPNDIYAIELNIDKIGYAKAFSYSPISKYPSIERDLAIVLKDDVKAAELLTLIEQTGRKYLTKVELFDVYKGEHIEAGYQSVAVSMTFNNKNETLKNKAVDKIIKKIRIRIERELDGKIRS